MNESSAAVQAELEALVTKQGRRIDATVLEDGSTVYQDGSILQPAQITTTREERGPNLEIGVVVRYASTIGIARLFARYFVALHREQGAK